MNNKKKEFLKRNIIALSFTSFLTDISSESVYAILPFYIISLGLGREIVGLVEGFGEFFSSLFKFLSGYIAQKIGRYKILACIGYLLSTISKPFFTYARSGYEIVFIKVVDRIGKGIRTSPRDALLALSSVPSYRGRAFGFHRALDTIGALLGPLLAIWLMTYYGYYGVFIFSMVPGIVAVLILWLFVREEKTHIMRKGFSIVKEFTITYWLFVLTVMLSGLSGYTQAFLLLRAEEIGWSKEFAIFFLIIANILYAVLAYPVGYYSDIFKRLNPYPLTFLIQVIGVMIIIYFDTLYTPLFFFIIYGIYMAFHNTLTRIMTSIYVKDYLKGIGYGIMHSFYGISALIGYYILGWFYEIYGYRLAFTYSMIIGLFGLTISFILVYKVKF